LKKFIAIAGNIGVGKSTLTALLCKYYMWEPFYEAVDDNPYLTDFYRDMKTWAFHSQVFFLSRRLGHHRQIIERPGTVVQDRTVYEDAEIFARNLYLQENISERDYRSYRELYYPLGAHSPARARLRTRDLGRVPGTTQSALRRMDRAFHPLPRAHHSHR
jgi:deoxyadenosine/deoxycytidine kinase